MLDAKLALSVASFAILLVACGKKEAPPPPFDTTLRVRDIMKNVIDPAAVRLWSRAGETTTAEGVEDLAPDTPEEWAAAESEASTVAEAANLLMLPGRPRAIFDDKGKVSIKDGGDWLKFAQNLNIRARAALDAVKARDKEKMFETGGELYQACVTCHEKYYIPFLKDGEFASPKAPQ